MAVAVERKERSDAADVLDLLWLGGFLDARGSLITRGIPRLVVRHEDEEIARRVAKLTGGTLKGPKRDKSRQHDDGSGAPYWLVTLYNFHSLKALFERVKPYISEVRYEQIMAALDAYDPPNAKRIEFEQENCGYYDSIRDNASGYVRHHRRGEEPCRMCTECERAYYRGVRARRRLA